MREIIGQVKDLIRKLIPNFLVNYCWHLPVAFLAVVYYRYPARKLKVIGVTGTNGKTTTVNLIYEILNRAGKKAAMVSTVSAKYGETALSTGFHTTTPSAWWLQKFYRRLVNLGFEYLVVETTSFGLDQFRLLGSNFLVGVMTNLSHEHFDYHQNFKNYLKAKARLFEKVKYKVLNKDDRSFNFLKNIGKGKILTYSLKKEAFINIDKANFGQKITSFKCQYLDFLSFSNLGKKAMVKTPLIGEFNLYNCLSAIAAAKVFGVKDQIIKKALLNFKAVDGRLEEIKAGQKFKVFVDFAHAPNAITSVLTAIKKIYRPKRLIAVFGSPGLRDPSKRPLMGKAASQLADILILTADDPRTEKVDDIIKQIEKGCFDKKKVIKEPDRYQAIKLGLTKIAKKGDCVAILGMGHQQTMAIGNKEIPWQDKKAVIEILKKVQNRHSERSPVPDGTGRSEESPQRIILI